MADNDAFAKLRTLSPSEFNVLKLYCQAYRYQDIAEELLMHTSSVKNYMGRVYVKLGLDQLPDRARTFTMARVYCPALKEFEQRKKIDKSFILVGKEEEPEPIKGELMKIVEEDDGGPDEVIEGEIIKIDTTPQVPPIDPHQRRKPNPFMIGFLVIASLSILFTGYSLYNRFFGQPAAILEQPIIAEQPEDEQVAIAEPTQTEQPQVIPTNTEVIPTATFTPEPTSPPKPAILFEDNFEDGLSDGWEVISGNPMVVNGMLSTDQQDTWLMVGDPSWKNYSIEFTSTEDEYNSFSTGFNAIGVHAQDIDNMYAFKWTESEGICSIVRNAEWSVVSQSEFKPGYSPYDIRITVKEDKISVFIDGELQASFFSNEYTEGRVVLKMYYVTSIDDFKIKEILE